MSEELVVRYCSPTLANMKTGSLFSCPCKSAQEVTDGIRRLNRRLAPKGIRVLPLRMMKDRVLVYLYRPQRLTEDFSCDEVRELLRACGYVEQMPEQCLMHLIKKLRCEKEFPHEIGLFLGYAPEDVRAFMQHRKSGCACVGCWRVYENPAQKQQLFQKYEKCTRIYCEQWEKGRTVEQLTVASA